MKRMRIKRVLSAVLSLALLTALTAVPGNAAGSSFSDVADQATAVNADVLRLMGVVDGVGSNAFNPGANLTRAEFCAMVVKFMQKGDLVPLHATRTIFTDVTSKHWGLGYVNLAASLTVKDGEKEVPLISGVGDGRFEPDSKITLAQAATILIRMLGYSSQQAGAVWPESYMNLASSIGLTDGISAGSYDAITRAQAAQLFVNALECKTQSGEKYYTTLGDTKEGVVVLAVNVESDTGEEQGAIRTSDQTYMPKVEGVVPTALQGQRGILVLNDKKELVSFLPDDSTPVSITLSADAEPDSLKGNGREFGISSDTLVYNAEETGGKSYVDSYQSLYAGTQLTVYTQRGKVVAIYTANGATPITADAVVVQGTVNTAAFYQLTGGASDFHITKNRQNISMSQIKPYDVVTYDRFTNTLVVSDLRLPCVYEDASPNAKTPKTITVAGNKFQVMESAWNTIKDFSLGQNVTLLLTADGKVAGMAKRGSQTNSTMIGEATGTGVKVFLPNGGTMELSGAVGSEGKSGQLVLVTASKGQLNLGSLPSQGTSSDFHISEMTLGRYTVAGGVRVYEKTKSGAMAPVDLSALGGGVIKSEYISSYHVNSSNQVDFIIIEDVTGNAYEYGMMVQTVDSTSDGEKTVWKLMRGTKEVITFPSSSGFSVKNGEMVAVTIVSEGINKGKYNVDSTLTEVKGVTSQDFFKTGDNWYVTKDGKTYLVSDQVECYVGDNMASQDSWLRQSDVENRLNAAFSYAKGTLTLYIDGVGQQVGVIRTN